MHPEPHRLLHEQWHHGAQSHASRPTAGTASAPPCPAHLPTDVTSRGMPAWVAPKAMVQLHSGASAAPLGQCQGAEAMMGMPGLLSHGCQLMTPLAGRSAVQDLGCNGDDGRFAGQAGGVLRVLGGKAARKWQLITTSVLPSAACVLRCAHGAARKPVLDFLQRPPFISKLLCSLLLSQPHLIDQSSGPEA